MWFVIGLFVGSLVGVLMMCLMQMARDQDQNECECWCAGDCSQGQACTCVKD